MKNIKHLTLMAMAVIAIFTLTFTACDVGGGGGSSSSGSGNGNANGNGNSGTFLNGTWSRTSGSYTYRIVLDNNNWTYYDGNDPVSKGTWTSSVTPAAGTNGTLTLTITQVDVGSGWVNLPAEYNSLKTCTAKYSINSGGNQLILSEKQLTAADPTGMWSKLEGTYAKDGGTGGGGGGGSSTWTAVTTSAFGSTDSIRGIAFGAGKFVAVGTPSPGSGGKMAYSTDGINWTAVTDTTFASGSLVYTVAYVNNRFIAGGTKMAASTDGINWTAVTNTPFDNDLIDFGSIAYGGSTFVAGGQKQKIMYSTNGTSWTYAPTNPFGSNDHIRSIAYSGSTFVAVSADYNNGNNGVMATSANGQAWTAVADTTFSTYGIYTIAYGGGRFVAGGSSGKMATSANGTTWTAVASTPFLRVDAIAFGNGKFVAGGNGTSSSSTTAYSADGTSWTAITGGAFSGSDSIRAIAFGNGMFVAVGYNGKIAYSSGL